MLDDKARAEFDQSAELLGEALPAMWKRIYDGCREQGFSEADSRDLLKTYITAHCQGMGGARL